MITNNQLDTFIDTAITRMSGDGTYISKFYVDLKAFQARITEKLVDGCIAKCMERGLSAERTGDGLTVTVDLRTCVMNYSQAATYHVAVQYVRQVLGRDDM